MSRLTESGGGICPSDAFARRSPNPPLHRTADFVIRR
jgi:hypothetical protein